MSDRFFVDTNILMYAHDTAAGDKHARANNEEAGEHWTPRDAVKLMAKLILMAVADEIESGTCLLHDGACGTGVMLTVAEETLLSSIHFASTRCSRFDRAATRLF